MHYDIYDSSPSSPEGRKKTSPELIPDLELMQRIQAGDEDALQALMKRFTPLLASIAGRILPRHQDVSDAVEETFISVWQQAPGRFDASRGAAFGWMVTILRRRAIDRMRQIQSYDHAGERLRQAVETQPDRFSSDDCHRDAANSAAGDRLGKMIDALPILQAQVIRLAYFGGSVRGN